MRENMLILVSKILILKMVYINMIFRLCKKGRKHIEKLMKCLLFQNDKFDMIGFVEDFNRKLEVN